MKITFKYIELTGLTQGEILRRARALRKAMNKRYPGSTALQQAVDCVIDAAIEHIQ